MARDRGRGFTLVELITVVIILGILAAVGVGRIPDTADYTERFANDEWLSALRLGQIVGLSRGSISDPVEVRFAQTSETWSYEMLEGGSSIRLAQEIGRDGQNIHLSTSDFGSACTSLSTASFPFSIYFNLRGNRAASDGISVTSNMRICVGAQEICISPAGYAYQGACL